MQSIRHFSISKWYQSVFSIDRFELEAKKKYPLSDYKITHIPHTPHLCNHEVTETGTSILLFLHLFLQS